MINSIKSYVKHHINQLFLREKMAVEAYDIWSENYDSQPGNLMLDVDELMLHKLLKKIDISDKKVADIGCGTGRHWAKILEENPSLLTGFDVSGGMLARLHEKFPMAKTQKITNNLFEDVPDESFDVIISTLTVAHIKNLKESLSSWTRILKKEGKIIITDFHPKALASGGKRTFRHKNGSVAVQNFVHYTNVIVSILAVYNFHLVEQDEIIIDESFRHYYENKNALRVYESFKGFPILYGMYFKRPA